MSALFGWKTTAVDRRIFIEDAHLQDRLNSSDCRVFGQLRNIDQSQEFCTTNNFPLKGGLVDFSFLAGEDLRVVQCHKAVIAAISPFMLSLLQDTETDQVILADFNVSALAGLMNICYSGK